MLLIEWKAISSLWREVVEMCAPRCSATQTTHLHLQLLGQMHLLRLLDDVANIIIIPVAVHLNLQRTVTRARGINMIMMRQFALRSSKTNNSKYVFEKHSN